MIRHDQPPDVAEERTQVLADAASVLAVDVDDGGFCRGWVTTRARLAPFPCPRVVWARSVQASLGGWDSATALGRDG